MTKQEFIDSLRKNGIDTAVISFDGEYKDGYCIRKNHCIWEVFVRERGVEYNSVGFPCESDALQYLYDVLCKVYAK